MLKFLLGPWKSGARVDGQNLMLDASLIFHER